MKIRIALLFVLMQYNAYCQDAHRSSPATGNDGLLAINIGIPINQMKQAIRNNMGNMGFGISGMYLFNPAKKNTAGFPLRIGFEGGYTYYGRFKSDVNVNSFTGDYKTSYGIANLRGVVRIRPKENDRFTPFADIFCGGDFYIAIVKQNLGLLETALGFNPVSFGDFSSASFSYGGGIGFSSGTPSHNGRFTLRLAYTMGSDIKYIVRNSVVPDVNNNRLVYSVGRAPLSYFMLQVGVGF